MKEGVSIYSRVASLEARGWDELDGVAGSISADSVVLWLDEKGSNSLRSVSSPLNPKLVGVCQPLKSGLISKVFLTGMALLEKDVKSRSEHDPTIDGLSGFCCRSMVAAPVACGGEIVGVLSAVRFEGGEGRSFLLEELNELVRVSRVLGMNLEQEEVDEDSGAS